jgi:hypothetical protein
MDQEHVISDEALAEIHAALQKNEHWMAYNEVDYFLGKENMCFFKNKEEADEFAAVNISEYDLYNVIHFESVADVFRKITYGESLDQQLFISSQQNHTIMNEQNFDYLKTQLKYTGFGEELQRELREKMSMTPPSPEFTLIHKTQFGDDKTEAALQFRKSDEADMYFFNRYFLQLKNEKGEESLTQSFRVGRENNITLKEGYNLMNGRAIYKEMTPKEGEKYHAWLQLNFKETNEHGDFKLRQFHENYGYDVKQVLAKYEIKELRYPDSAKSVIRSLERGNRQSVTIMHDGKEHKMSIEASPQFKSLNIYDSESRRVNIQVQKGKQGEHLSQHQSQKESKKQAQGENQTEKQTERESQKQGKKQKQKESAGDAEEGGGKLEKKQSRRQRQTLA